MIKKYIVSYCYGNEEFRIGQGEIILEKDFEKEIGKEFPDKEYIIQWQEKFGKENGFDHCNVWLWAEQ